MSTSYTNPVEAAYLADPFVWFHEGFYYAIGTGPPEVEALERPRVLPMFRSTDLVKWTPLEEALVRPDRSLGRSFWAPEVAYHEGVFYLYYSVGHGDKGQHLRVATSTKPEGPYDDVGRPLLPLETCPFSIDGHPFRDDDGQWYLFYATDFLDTDDDARPGTALVVDRLIDMTQLAGEPKVVLRPRYDWQIYQRERAMYGSVYDWHTLEGPFVRKHDGKYYCIYSGGNWQSDGYGVDYGVATSAMGPYDGSGGADGSRVLRTLPPDVIGPGHCSIVRRVASGTDYVAYHAWDAARTARRLCIDPLDWTRNGPRCSGPTTTPTPLR